MQLPLFEILKKCRKITDSARCRPPFRDDLARGEEASSGCVTVPPFGFAKGELDADGEACDAPCARCDQIEVGRDADPRDSAAGGDGRFERAVDDPLVRGIGAGLSAAPGPLVWCNRSIFTFELRWAQARRKLAGWR
jgi:hypothetical protein